ncbi:MAG: hypothetical protein IID51_05505 [Proteobacteria bacterium]|nr:hypothetical protein [Pseudomonadota bacterium]
MGAGPTNAVTELLPAMGSRLVPSGRITGYNAAMTYSRGFIAAVQAGLAALIVGLAVPASAQQEGDWVVAEFARSRLVADYVNLPPEGPVTVFLAWEVIMPPGWKTYWRSPGEAGKPPVFGWEGSVNLASAEPLFPLPQRFELFDVQNLGYAGRLLLPIRIAPAIPGAPISVKATVDFLICKDICVPMQAAYALDLPVAVAAEIKSSSADDIHAALLRVPRSPSISANGLVVRGARVFGPPGNQRLTIDVEGPELMSAADVFVEAGQGVMFDAPRRALTGDGTRAQLTFSAGDYSGDLDLRGRTLTLTLTDGMGRAIETTFTLVSP